MQLNQIGLLYRTKDKVYDYRGTLYGKDIVIYLDSVKGGRASIYEVIEGSGEYPAHPPFSPPVSKEVPEAEPIDSTHTLFRDSGVPITEPEPSPFKKDTSQPSLFDWENT